jgi:predicted RNA-binding Zn-ribbon protein involved in translation (DUF1610 family)
MSTRAPADGPPTDRAAGKGTLFCVACPYRSRYDDGWTVVETDDRVHYLCPNCGTEILSRNRPGSVSVRRGRPSLADGGAGSR